MSSLDVLNSVTSTTTDVTGGISSLAAQYKKFSKYANKGKGASHIRDLYTNGFLSRNSVFVPQFFSRAFDEPTYLTFRVEFDLEGDYPNNKIYTQSNKAYNMYDYMPEPFFVMDDSSVHTKYSTYNYLRENLGEIGRAKIIKDTIEGMRDLQNVFPYYFHSISGLENLLKIDPKRGQRLGDDAIITLKCYEGIDMKVAQVMQGYRKVVWNDRYQRWALPDMMRYFTMKIYISELRMFHDYRNITGLNAPATYDFSDGEIRNMTYRKATGFQSTIQAIDQGISAGGAVMEKVAGTASTANQWYSGIQGMYQDIEGTTMNIINGMGELCNNVMNEVMPAICLECHMCEFDITEAGSFLGELTSSRENSKAVEHTIKIKVGNVIERQVYPLNVHIQCENGSRYSPTNMIDDELLDKQLRCLSSHSLEEIEGKYTEELNNKLSDTSIHSTLHRFTNAKYSKNGKSSMYEGYVNDDLSYNPTQLEADDANLAGTIISDVYSTVNSIYNVTNSLTGAFSRSSATNGSVPTVDLGMSESYKAQEESIKQSLSLQNIPNPYAAAIPEESDKNISRNSIYEDGEGGESGKNEEKKSIYDDALTVIAGNAAAKTYIAAIAKSVYGNPAIRSMAVGDQEKRVIMDNVYKSILDKMSESGAFEGTEAGETIDNIRQMLSDHYKPSTYEPEKRKSAFDAINGQ